MRTSTHVHERPKDSAVRTTLIVQKWKRANSSASSDGITLHVDAAAHGRYLAFEQRCALSKRVTDGMPYTWNDADAKSVADAKASGDGFHTYVDTLPGSGGASGWRY